MLASTGLPMEIPKDVVESTEALMKSANIADKLGDMTDMTDMTDEPMEAPNAMDGSIAKAIERLTPHMDTMDIH